MAFRSAFALRSRLVAALALALALALSIGAPAVEAQSGGAGTLAASERSVKAAFLFKFPAYVEWPVVAPPESTALVIGVAGGDEMLTELNAIVAAAPAGGRTVSVRRVREGDPPADVQILFVGRAQQARLREYARLAQQRGLLLVTESAGALEQGSMVNFVIAEGRVRFEVSLENVERAGLKLSSRLLAVAVAVKGTP